MKGYFHAPTAGVYRFSVTADDDFLMQLSTTKNNANLANLQQLLKLEKHNTNHYTSFSRVNVTQSSANVTLSEGYYYFEIVNVNYGGAGYFKVMVDMPSLRQYTINPTWQVDKFVIKPSQFDAEIIKVRVFGASGNFDLFYYDSNNYLKLMNVVIGDSADAFKEKLGNLPNINDYSPTVTLDTLDASGAITTTPSAVEGY